MSRQFADLSQLDSVVTLSELYDFAGLQVKFSSTSNELIEAVRGIMRPSSQPSTGSTLFLDFSAELGSEWVLTCQGYIFDTLPKVSPAPVVAQHLIAGACAAVAERQQSIVIRGAVFEKDGAGLALLGSDLDAVKALALHLHARRWCVVSFEYSFLQPHNLEIIALQQLVSINSKSIETIPNTYRRAVEASRWYNSGQNLTFYAVDPYVVHATHSLSTRLTFALLMEPTTGRPLSSYCKISDVHEIEMVARHEMASAVRKATVSPANPIASCDAIENWFATANAH